MTTIYCLLSPSLRPQCLFFCRFWPFRFSAPSAASLAAEYQAKHSHTRSAITISQIPNDAGPHTDLAYHVPMPLNLGSTVATCCCTFRRNEGIAVRPEQSLCTFDVGEYSKWVQLALPWMRIVVFLRRGGGPHDFWKDLIKEITLVQTILIDLTAYTKYLRAPVPSPMHAYAYSECLATRIKMYCAAYKMRWCNDGCL